MTYDYDDLPGWSNPWPVMLRLGDRKATTHEYLTPEQTKEQARLKHQALNKTEARKAYKLAWMQNKRKQAKIKRCETSS